MNWLKFSSWSINVKIFVIIFIAFMTLNIINTPLIIETITNANRQAFRQVVTEIALRQQDAIDEDFNFALNLFEAFQETRIPYLSVSQWLTRSDPTTEGFGVNATQTKSTADRALTSELLSLAPTSFRQAWLIDANGQVISNVTNLIDPRYTVDVGEYIDASNTPAHRAGQLLGESTSIDRRTDLVVEEVGGRLSIQLISAIVSNNGEFNGTLAIELNNVGVFTNNIQTSGANEDVYSFIASPENATVAIALGQTDRNLINLNTQATRSSANLQQAEFYLSGNRPVIGFYTPLFDNFRNDVIFVVELDEATALQDVAISVVSSSTSIIFFQLIFLVILIVIVNRIVVYPINVVTDTIRAIGAGDLTSRFSIDTSDDEIGKLVEATIQLRRQLDTFTSDMSSRVDARTRDLQVTQEIGRAAISETNLDRLMTQVVNLITERFDQIYHAQIFLIEGNYAVLKASTGEAGEQLLAKGHRLAVGSLSVIGQVAQQNQSIIARDTTASGIHHQNEFLRRTRAELATPIRLGSQIIGALDVQSTTRDVFDEDLVTIIETLTAQVAIAIENSRLYEQSQQRLQEYETANRQRTQHNWGDFMHSQRTQRMVTHAGAQITNDYSSLREQATTTRQMAVGSITERNTIPIAIPVIIRDQILGVIEWEISEQEFSQNHILLAEELSSRLAISLDNARLVQAGRQTADNERIINTISAKISGQTDIEQILQTAIEEVGQALRAPRVNIQLQKGTVSQNGHQDSDHQPTSNT
jgi:GAF domain-containing protein